MAPLALRMDDVGASSKRYEVYSKWSPGVGPVRLSGNWLFLKYLPPFRAWGPYAELDAAQWQAVCELLEAHSARLTVAVTAAWVEREDSLIPFPERFPRQAEAIRRGVNAGLLEVANHGLTHCVVEGNRFKPKWFAGNRQYHREFWEWVPSAVQREHLERSQQILRDWVGDVVTFVPPGNVFTEGTLELAADQGLRYLSCQTPEGRRGRFTVVGNAGVVAFHDRDLVLNGVGWLGACLQRHAGADFCFVKDLGRRLDQAPAVVARS